MYKHLKRILDIIFSILLMLLLLPMLAITFMLVKLTSRGPALFHQERIGLHGRIFKIFKFRTMINGAEKVGTGQYSYKDDPRVTKMGTLLRATSIDELPQLINILKGDMSFVGPRPPLVYHPKHLHDYSDFEKSRFLVRPGVTGLAQINGRKRLSWNQRFTYDNQYVNKMSLATDITILIKTIFVLFKKEDNVNVGVTTNSIEGDKND